MDSGVKPGNDEEKERRHYCRDHLLTFVPFIVTSPIISPARTPPGDAGGEGRGGSRGRGCQPRSRAAPGQNARPARRPACGLITPAALGRPGVGNTRSYLVPSQEVRELELSGGVRSLPQVPWWNAGRRARPRAEGRRKPPFRGAPRTPLACRSWNTASAGVPLPFFYLFVARMSKAKSGMGLEASRSYPHIAPLMRATGERVLDIAV